MFVIKHKTKNWWYLSPNKGLTDNLSEAHRFKTKEEAESKIDRLTINYQVVEEIITIKKKRRKNKMKKIILNNKQKYYASKLLDDITVTMYTTSFIKKLDYDYNNIIRRRIRNIRESIRVSNRDLLQCKHIDYGNKGKWGLAKIRELADVVYKNKTPDKEGLGQWVSVEIECVFPSEKEVVQFVSFVRKNKLSKYITVKGDGSIDEENKGCECDSEYLDEGGECDCGAGSGHVGREIVVSYRKDLEPNTINLTCKELTRLGVWVNKSCGLHVHFDMRNAKSRTVTTLGQRVALCVPALKQMLPKSRQNNSYCMHESNSMRKGSRYSFVNFHAYTKYQTLEIRGHSGTLDPIKIHNWIKIIERIMMVRNKERVLDIPTMISKFNFGALLTSYIMDRYQKFTKTEQVKGDDVKEDQQSVA